MAEIRNYNGRPAIMVDGKAYPPMMATIRTNARDRMIVDENYYRELGAAGIKIYFLICDTVWLKPQALELFREEAEILLRVCPDALIIPRIGLHPTNEWIKEHPGECVTYSDGSRPAVRLYTESYETDLPGCYSLCSAEWRRDAGKALEETWKLLMALPYADHIIGCFLAAGGTSEWYDMVPPDVGSKKLTAGYSDAFGQAFRKYLRDKYGNDEALRDAWRKYAKLSDPAIPGPEGHFFRAGVENEAMSPRFRMSSNAAVPEPPGSAFS